jgi:hypothetical protein
VRELYTDNEEILTNKANPMAANGIAEFVDRPDLAERSIFVNLLPISDDVRKTEEDFFADFAAAHPKILGAIFDLLSAGLRRIEDVKERGLKLPRMADFARWAIACTGEEFGEETFKKNYDENIRDAVSSVLEASPVAQALIAEMDEGGAESISLTASQWLKTLSDRVGKRVSKSRGWPSTPRAMSDQLRRAAGYLRRVGLEVSPSRRSGHKRDRLIAVSRSVSFSGEETLDASSVSSSASAFSEEEQKYSNFSDLGADDRGLREGNGADGENRQSAKYDENGENDRSGLPNSQSDRAEGAGGDAWEVEY